MLQRPMLAASWHRFRDDPAQSLSVFALFLFGFVIPIDPTLVAVVTVVIVVLWLVRGRFRRLPAQWNQSVVVRASLILFALLALGLLYTSADLSDGLTAFKKYRELLLVPILMALTDNERERRIAIWGFVASMLLTLCISFGEALGWYNVGRPSEPTAFFNRIIYGIFLVYTMFWAAHRALDGAGMQRLLWLLVVVVGTYMVLYATGSRTAYVLYFAMALLFAWQKFAWRGAIVGSLVLAVLLLIVLNTSPIFSHRIDRAIVSTMEHKWGTGGSPTGNRLDQWRRSVLAIGDAPLFGHGTGGYGAAVSPYSKWQVRNSQPHNEYLLITVQLGAVGLIVFLWLLVAQWRTAGRLPPPDRYLGQGILACFAIACAFNSSLLNSPEGHFWAFFAAMLFAPPEHGRAVEGGAVGVE
ncbi:MAG: O-antigen ligase family protein [Alphaproteobacteria bacterium]|nr:O-antigen ligase family protein [Alphaproteobacteria bacterium]